MRPPAAADVDRVSFRAIDVLVEIYLFREKWTLVSSGYMAACSYPPKKIISLPLSLSPSFFILFVRTHLRRYTFIAKIITKYRREKHSRISKGANQRNSVLWNLFCSLYHLFASLSSRNAAMLTLTSFHKRELKALSSL